MTTVSVTVNNRKEKTGDFNVDYISSDLKRTNTVKISLQLRTDSKLHNVSFLPKASFAA